MNTQGTTQLQRTIGLSALVLFGVGDILGAGIYGLVGKAAGEMGNAIWLAFFASMIAAGLTGLSYASLGSRYPVASGASFITQKAYQRIWLSYGVGLAILASGLTSMATATRVFSGYFQGLFVFEIPLPVVIIGFSLALAFIVFWGIKESMWANAVCTVIELAGLAIIIFVGLKFVGSVDYLDAKTISNPNGDISFSIILTGAVLTFYSFIGFEDMLNIAEEVKSPKINLPLGLLLSVSIASLIYMLISIIAVSVVPSAELANSKQPLVDVMKVAAPWFPSSAYSVIAMFAVANTALLNFVMGSRLMYGMAKQKLLPMNLAKVHSTRQTPYIATLTILIILLTLALSGNITSLAKSTSLLLLICFFLVNVALIILKTRKNEPKGSFEVPTIIPLLGASACAGMLFFVQGPEIKTAAVILSSIAVLYFVLKPKISA